MYCFVNRKVGLAYIFRGLLLAFSFVQLSHSLSAQKVLNQVTVADLKSEWLVQSASSSQLTPYIPELHDPKSISIFLNLNKYNDYFLALNVPEKSSLLIENSIVNYYHNSQWHYFSVDSLKTKYQKDQLLITLFSEGNIPRYFETLIKDFNPNKGGNTEAPDLSASKRSLELFGDFNILSIVIVLIIGVAIKSSQGKVYNEYFDFKKAYSLKPKSEILYSLSLLSVQNLMFLLFYGITMGFSLATISSVFAPQKLVELGYGNIWDAMGLGLIITVLTIFLMLIKYPFLRVIANVFMFRKSVHVHYYEYQRFSIFISCYIYFVAILNSFSDGTLLQNQIKPLIWIWIFLLLARVILIFFKLNKLYSFQKLHLFSYLCSTEIIPLIILLKFFKIYIGVF